MERGEFEIINKLAETNMKSKINIAVFGLVLIIACSSISKKNNPIYFEGKIEYKTSFISKVDNLDTSILHKLLGYTSTFYIKEGNYKQIYDMADLLEETHLKDDNKVFMKKNNTDTLFWYDCSKAGGKILKYEINQNKEMVLGIECNELITYYDNNKIESFYYNSDTLKVNPEWYKNFNYLNKNFTTEKMGSLFLKCKIEYPQCIAIITASSIYPQKLDNQFFQIPNNSILIEQR